MVIDTVLNGNVFATRQLGAAKNYTGEKASFFGKHHTEASKM